MQIVFSLRLPREAASVPVVRRLCRTNLTELGVDANCIDDIALAVTEACANVVLHAVAAQDYTVQVEIDHALSRITVIDNGGGDATGRSVQDNPLLLESGRGLELMQLLVDDLHFEPDAAGTTVMLTKRLDLSSSSPLLLGADSAD